MKLPGGLLLDGTLKRNVRLNPLTGWLERAIVDSGLATRYLPEQITEILTYAVHDIDGVAADQTTMASLCSGDRQFLMQQLSTMINPQPQWLTVPCGDCKETIQLQWQAVGMPVKPAGANFPACSVKLSIGEVMVRVPNGADEQAVAELMGLTSTPYDPNQALGLLLKRLITAASGDHTHHRLNDDDKDLLDETIEAMMPQVADSISSQCPYCQEQQVFMVDNFAWITDGMNELDEDIHIIASQYHWSEQQILNLPKHRRQRYLQLINPDHFTDHGDIR